jgi:hypothetical protein
MASSIKIDGICRRRDLKVGGGCNPMVVSRSVNESLFNCLRTSPFST